MAGPGGISHQRRLKQTSALLTNNHEAEQGTYTKGTTVNEQSPSTTSRHNDPDGPFGYVPTDPWMRAFEALQKAELIRDSEARCLADAVVMPADEAWRIPIRAEYYRRAVANNDYARGVWEQVCERRGVPA